MYIGYDCHYTYARVDWIEQCFTSLPTQYRLYGRWFLLMFDVYPEEKGMGNITVPYCNKVTHFLTQLSPLSNW